MESLVAALVLATLITRFLGRDRATLALFALSLGLAAILFHHYATDALKLAF